jgi:uncharacterized protein involved in oxidation of intracellular sulfur
MKKLSLIILILLSSVSFEIYAQCGGTTAKTYKPTSIGFVIYSNDVETIWNALRLANFSLSAGDTVKIFLLGKGVELDTMAKKNPDVKEQTDLFLKAGGTILGCGTCLQSRNNLAPQVCKMSSMSDLYDIIRKSKIVITF